MPRWIGVAALTLLLVLTTAPVAAADGGSYEQIVDLTFPTHPEAAFTNDYHAPRSGGRVHMATDLIGEKLWALYAAVDGTVCQMTGLGGTPPSWGFAITICGDDGRSYHYLHLNDDSPGTTDMAGGPQHAYAPAMNLGGRVHRGELVGWMGDSGNAKGVVPHLHLEIHDPDVVGPYGESRINPYHSLVAALERDDVSDGRVWTLLNACPAPDPAPFTDVASSPYEPAISCAAAWQVAHGRADGTFGPAEHLNRGQMASLLTRLLALVGVELPTEDELDADGIDFDDITTNTHRLAIRQIAALGIARGYDGQRFGPGDRLTRAQTTSLLVQTVQLVTGEELDAGRDAFVDDDRSVHEGAINAAVAARLADGIGPGRFGPTRRVTREVMADFVARALDHLAATGHLPAP